MKGCNLNVIVLLTGVIFLANSSSRFQFFRVIVGLHVFYVSDYGTNVSGKINLFFIHCHYKPLSKQKYTVELKSKQCIYASRM
jgi:hypothetical protein